MENRPLNLIAFRKDRPVYYCSTTRDQNKVTITTTGETNIWLNGILSKTSKQPLKNHTIQLDPKKTNFVNIKVAARMSPSLLYVNRPNSFTWFSSQDGIIFKKAKALGDWDGSKNDRQHFTVAKGLRDHGGLLLILYGFGGLVYLVFHKFRNNGRHLIWLTRFIIWSALLALAILNWRKVSEHVIGFDAPEHLQYIFHIVYFYDFPQPYSGWQTFQTPLYYIISALFQSWVKMVTGKAALATAMIPIVNIICSYLQVEICGKIFKEIGFSASERSLGMIFIAAIPMNLYMAFAYGNEPLCGLLSSLGILFFCKSKSRELTTKESFLLGGIIGLAILAKISSIILAAVVMCFLGTLLLTQKFNIKKMMLLFSSFFGVCAWYFYWVYQQTGRLILTGWDPNRELPWWQDPWFRQPSDMLNFGEALIRPFFASVNGFWDGFFSSFWLDSYGSGLTDFQEMPWNTSIMTPLVIPGLVFSIIMLVGFLRLIKEMSLISTFFITLFLMYFWACIHVYFDVATNTIKASYTLACLSIFGTFFLSGMKRLKSPHIIQASAFGLFFHNIVAHIIMN